MAAVIGAVGMLAMERSVSFLYRDIPSIPDETNAVAEQIVDAAFTVHSALGPGLLEGVYEVCLAQELKERNLKVSRQVPLKVEYKGLELEAAYRVDLVVNDRVIVELKAVESVTATHKAQVKTYLKLYQKRLGLLINFNVALIKWGITRIAL
jgi:GxxExxY protein